MILRPLLAAAALAALPASAVAQDVEPPTGPPINVTLSAPASVTKAELKKGVRVLVTCQAPCNARLTLTGNIGIVTTKSGDVPETGRFFTVKAQRFQLKALKKGTKLTVAVDARTADDGGGQASRKIKLR